MEMLLPLHEKVIEHQDVGHRELNVMNGTGEL